MKIFYAENVALAALLAAVAACTGTTKGSTGKVVEIPCTPNCSNGACSDNGCGGTCSPCSGDHATLYLYPSSLSVPVGAYQTATAIIVGVSDKTVTWTTDGGTIVGTNPCVLNEPCTVALYSATPGTFHLTATSNAETKVSASMTVVFTSAPVPVTAHPRLLVTPAMLDGLRTKATQSNPIYQSLLYRANLALDKSNSFHWNWSCPSITGGTGGTGLPASSDEPSMASQWLEHDAFLFAFLSLVAPTDTERHQWGCYGHDLWMYSMSLTVKGVSGMEMQNGNRWSDSAQAFTLTADWLRGSGALSDSDWRTTHDFFAFVIQRVLRNLSGSTAPVAKYNDISELQSSPESRWDLTAMRAMGNNYTFAKLLYLVAAGLTFDDTPADDPALSNTCGADRHTVCASDYTAGSLRAYWDYLTGAMLYKEWGHLEDPVVTWKAYDSKWGNVPTPPMCASQDTPLHPCLGDGRGGESVEGSWYRSTLFRFRYALNAIQSAGYNDPVLYGPQLSLVTSSWWDLNHVAETEFLTGRSGKNAAFNYWMTGDSNSYYRFPSDYAELSSMLVSDSYTGRSDRASGLLWTILNSAYGGPVENEVACSGYCGFLSELNNDIASMVAMDLFIALPAGDPTATDSLPPDPRPSMPLDFYDAGNQHILARSGWTGDDVAFSYYCPNTLIDHEHSFCGRFDIFRKGEYITKGRSAFNDYNQNMTVASQNNTVSIQNPRGKLPASDEWGYPALYYGGQLWHAEQDSMSPLLHAELPSYVAALVDMTGFYNGAPQGSFSSFNAVSHVSRSLLYLRAPNQVVFYDRAETDGAGFKEVHVVTTGKIDFPSATIAHWKTQSGGQDVYLTSLLPTDAAISDAPLIASTATVQADDWEVVSTVKVSAATSPSARFLTVLEFGDVGLSRSATASVASTAGTAFEGAKVGNSLAMFKRDWNATFISVTYSPAGATNHYVADLKPSHGYVVTQAGTPMQVMSDTAGVVSFTALGTGDVTVADPG
jgi:hypothetical protein